MLLDRLMAAKQEPQGTLDELATAWHAAEFDPLSSMVGLEALAWAALLKNCPDALAPRSWAEVLHKLIDLASFRDGVNAGRDVWLAQLLFGELAVTLAYYFPELPRVAPLAAAGAEFISESLVELLDGAGMPAAGYLELTRPLLASWTRSLCIVGQLSAKKSSLVTRKARTQFAWLVRQALRTTRGDGSPAFAARGSSRESRDRDQRMFSLGLKLIDDRQDRALARQVLDHEAVAQRRLPSQPAYQSEWGGVAVLQPEWSPLASRLVVAYGDNRPRIELTNRGQVVICGDWSPELSIDGSVVEVDSEWECVCWFSDDDVDFMELEAKLSNGWTLQRQSLMARQDQFLWMADVLLGDAPATIDYCLDLMLPEQVEFRSAVESTEGMLQGKKPLALVCAPSLPEWKSASRGRALQASANPHSLRITHSCRGRAAYLPVFFDLHRRRMSQPITWRQLTVAEQLQIVARDLAVGFRVHVGIEQWIFYRSLTQAGNRSLIGQNYSSEFACGRFLNDGDVEPLIEVEAADP